MTTQPASDRLYHLLPAIYRLRDARQGDVLRALMAVIEEEFVAVETDIAQLYDNWFIETCDEWVVPYIGDLLAVRPLHPATSGYVSQRSYVANTIRYRRRKGTAAVLEQLARDVTGWPAKVVEFFQLLDTTQALNHPRLENVRTPDIRDANALELIVSPFEQVRRTAEVRPVATARGRYNIPNVGIFLWRLQAFPVVMAPASQHAPGLYRFTQLGYDLHLINLPRTETSISQRAGETNMPGFLRRRDMYDDLEAYRQAVAAGRAPVSRYLSGQPALQVWVDGDPEPIAPEQVLICNLSDNLSPPPTWRQPSASRTYHLPDGTTVDLPIRVAIDPELGRLAFPEGEEPMGGVHVSYFYGFGAELGGGFYDRRDDLPEVPASQARYVISVADPAMDTIQKALAAWGADGRPSAVIEFDDSEIYSVPDAPESDISLPAEAHLELRAGNRVRPTLLMEGAWHVTGAAGSTLTFNGLVVAGGEVQVLEGELEELGLVHSTLVPGHALTGSGTPVNPGQASLSVHESNGRLTVRLRRSISGPLLLAVDSGKVDVVDSIVDSCGTTQPALVAGTALVVTSTILGAARFITLDLASDAVFMGPVTVERRQEGCVRFSHVPDGSRTPRRFRCQPNIPANATQTQRRAMALRVRPVFTSVRYGQPGYCQLTPTVSSAISRGASDEGEMGAFHHLQQPHREGNLRSTLDEYLRFGLEAGIFYVS